MAKVRLVLDTRKSAKSASTGLFPIAIRLFHRKTRIIRLSYSTSPSAWDDKLMKIKKSAANNEHFDCSEVNEIIYDKLHIARKLIVELDESIDLIGPDILVGFIRKAWKKTNDITIRQEVENGLTLSEWGKVIIDRKLKSNKPGTAEWYNNGINAFNKFNLNKVLRLDEINVTFLKDFQIEHESKGNSNNAISSYMRAIRAIYNSAIKEDQFVTKKNPFEHFRIPTTRRTKKKAIVKMNFMKIRNLNYKKGSPIWHAKNYTLIMFNCRGMNFVDLVKLQVKDLVNDRIFYGRSKTGDQLSVRITDELKEILCFYLRDKTENDYLFPANYDGSTKSYEKYKSLRRRMNGYLKIIANDAGIEEAFTTYTIRHSWATIAKYMGISTEIISEGLGHNSLRTTEIYLKSFTNNVLDEANELVVS
ncbi:MULTISPECIES: tyrosine-type recombinase/integrase [Arenibacter]|uniref:tyrosine-type recombinase/integrase n=1 Tax=Arenibacter TaxID=178469 RepID=UPI0004DF738E|nr:MULTISPECIES: site-specific integrase [Arenibacter]GBF17985.1 site-specific tyrosine recombinase XerC [Arenibacter sp. NBRC 103722]